MILPNSSTMKAIWTMSSRHDTQVGKDLKISILDPREKDKAVMDCFCHDPCTFGTKMYCVVKIILMEVPIDKESPDNAKIMGPRVVIAQALQEIVETVEIFFCVFIPAKIWDHRGQNYTAEWNVL